MSFVLKLQFSSLEECVSCVITKMMLCPTIRQKISSIHSLSMITDYTNIQHSIVKKNESSM